MSKSSFCKHLTNFVTVILQLMVNSLHFVCLLKIEGCINRAIKTITRWPLAHLSPKFRENDN